MIVGPGLFVIVFNVGILSANAWDIAVAVGGNIEFINATGSVLGYVSERMSEVGALAYSSEQSRMFFIDNEISNGSIFEMSVPRVLSSENEERRISVVVSKQMTNVKGLAYDDKLGILYWSNGEGHTISYLNVSDPDVADPKGQPGQQLLRLEDQVPMGLAIDSCERYLYWTNCPRRNPTIERSLMNGAERKTLINSGLVRPYSIVVDQVTHRIYWVEELPGYAYRLGSADLDGNDRRDLIQGWDHQPFSLAVAASQVFWTDHMSKSVWSVVLSGSNAISQPQKVITYPSSPKALVSSVSSVSPQNHERCKPVVPFYLKVIPATVTTTTVEDAVTEGSNSTHHMCLNGGIWIWERGECDCLPDYSGKICEVKKCLDYCIHGECLAETQGPPQCSCHEGYSGQRCEVYACHNFCLSGSTCSIDVTGRPNCHCHEGFSGERCEVNFTQQQETKDQLQEVCKTFCKLWAQSSKEDLQPYEVCSCGHEVTPTWSGDYLLITLLAFCSFLLVIVAVLIKKVVVLRKRPRIKKRIIVNKSVTPLTCRPSPGSNNGDQCEITIENCCNMNICETPCFEPDFRQPQEKQSKSSRKGEKEEKKTLLGSMDLPPDDLY